MILHAQTASASMKLVVIGFACIISSGVLARDADSGNHLSMVSDSTASAREVSRAERLPFNPTPPRYLEDYEYLEDEALRTDLFDPIRYIAIGKSSYLSLGGSLRYSYDYFDQPNFGLNGVGNDHYWQSRAQVHADLHLFDDAVRAFVQFTNTGSQNKEIYSPYDRSDTEIQQAFVDFRLPQREGDRFYSRLGRQEMGLGDLALVDIRAMPNVRLSFDGARFSYRSREGYKLDAFAVRPVGNVRRGSFNDSSKDSGDYYGLYGTLPLNEGLNQDIYALSYQRDERTLNGISGEEDRHTAGTRLFGEQQGFDYSLNLMYQFGKFDNQDIRAWGVLGGAGYTFTDVAANPRLGLSLMAASGDDDRHDGRSNTFDPMFSANGLYFGNAGVTTLSNLVAVGPRLTLTPGSSLKLSPSVLTMWRESQDDAAYMPGMNAIPGTADVSGKRLGTSYNMRATWSATNNLIFDIEYQYYDVSDVIRHAGGEDMQMVALRSYFIF
ncbi:alginate export family protein [Halomonas binhaiensis]|uniref:Alginate export family protein n=1 Tax=Halomonas binhaiensis TaxID=2562282 RepID=A0A5C1NEU2_9GAMM|nr:alginate export family protein [Halomonas binhaiensis]QEM82232.1 alginate export family protein [Halomonas binhaiensis]